MKKSYFVLTLDKDECLTPNICRPPRPKCVNIPGSYKCESNNCQDGYERGRNGECEGMLYSPGCMHILHAQYLNLVLSLSTDEVIYFYYIKYSV